MSQENNIPSSMPSFRESMSSPNRNSQVVAPTSPAVTERNSLWLNSLPRQLGQTRTSGLAYPGASSEPTSMGLASQHLTSQRSMMSNNSGNRRRRGDINPGRVMQHLLYSSLGSDLPEGAQTPNHQSSAHDPTSDPTAVQRVIWGTNVDVTEAISMFKDFISNFTMAHKIRFMAENSNEMDNEAESSPSDHLPFYDHYLSELLMHSMNDMNLDCSNLKAYAPSRKLYNQLIRYPQEIITLLDHALTEVFLQRFTETQFPEAFSMKVRPFNLERNINLRGLDPSDIDQLVTVKGLLIRASPVIPDLITGFFRCSVCEQTIEVENTQGRVREPTICPREVCKSKNTMRLVHNRCSFANKQVYRLQETPDEIPDGQTPYTVSMCAYEEMVDVIKPGDRVEITGIFRGVPVKENSRRRAIKSLFKTYVDIVHIKRVDKSRIGIDASIRGQNEYTMDFIEDDRIQKDDPEEEERIRELSQRPDLYEILSQSVAPSIFGLEDVKKGVLLQLFGGANKFNKNKPGAPRIRGELNVLLVGDPGVSKSQLLQYVHKLAPRGVYTSGKGSSAVGLTAYITRDPDTRQLVLESGALVLSDGGICCIDEFDKMTDYTRSVLHEVMEQQTISVAKAGIITTLNARTSILASANPINSKFDTKLSVAQNVNLPPPLMSRFDLLYLILDKPNERDDRRLAAHLVSLFMPDKNKLESEREFVPLELFTKYVNYAKQKVHPVISAEAGEALTSYYVTMRKSGSAGGFNVVTFTTRQLESMIRLSEAHAKMRLSPVVEVSDVNEANRLIMSALQTAAMDPRTGKIDLDLVITGISSNSRQLMEQKRLALVNLLDSMDKSTIKWAEVYRLYLDQSDEHVSERDFNRLLLDLVDEGSIHMSGRNNAEKVIRKTK